MFIEFHPEMVSFLADAEHTFFRQCWWIDVVPSSAFHDIMGLKLKICGISSCNGELFHWHWAYFSQD